MAAEELPDFDRLLVALRRAEQREREVSTIRRKLHDRIDNGFGNDVTHARERQLSAERLALHRRIDELRRQLAPILRRAQ